MAKKQTSVLSGFMSNGARSKNKTPSEMQRMKRADADIDKALNKASTLHNTARKKFANTLKDIEDESNFYAVAIQSKTETQERKQVMIALTTINDAIALAMNADNVSEEAVQDLLNKKDAYYKELEKTAHGTTEKDDIKQRRQKLSQSVVASMESYASAVEATKTLEKKKKEKSKTETLQTIKKSGLATALLAPLLGIFGPLGKDIGKLLNLEKYATKLIYGFGRGVAKVAKFTYTKTKNVFSSIFSRKELSDSGSSVGAAAVLPFIQGENNSAKEDEERDKTEDWRRENIRQEREALRNEKKGGLLGFLGTGLGWLFSKFLSAKSLIGGWALSLWKSGWIGKLLPMLGRFSLIGTAGFLGYKFGDWLNQKLGLSDKILDFFMDNGDPNKDTISTEDAKVLAEYKSNTPTVYTSNAPISKDTSKVAQSLLKAANANKTASGQSMESLIKQVSSKNNVDYGLMMAIAGRESGFVAQAKAGTSMGKHSSASGLFQITSDTWKGLFKDKERAARLRAQGVTENPDDRFDPMKNAIAAVELFNEYKKYAKNAGLNLTPEVAYAYHFLGPKGSLLFTANQNESAMKVLGKNAALSNIPIFFADYQIGANKKILVDEKGYPIGAREKTVGEVRQFIEGKMSLAHEFNRIAGFGEATGNDIHNKTQNQLDEVQRQQIEKDKKPEQVAQQNQNQQPMAASIGASSGSSDGGLFMLDNGLVVADSNALFQ